MILLLALSVGRIPVPWVHSHGWLNGEELAVHLESSHFAGCECELTDGVHLHVFTWRDASSTPDGVNNLPVRSDSNLYDRTQCVSLPANGTEVMEQLNSTPAQLIVACLYADGDADSPMNSADFADRTSARVSLDAARANLGVYLL